MKLTINNVSVSDKLLLDDSILTLSNNEQQSTIALINELLKCALVQTIEYIDYSNTADLQQLADVRTVVNVRSIDLDFALTSDR